MRRIIYIATSVPSSRPEYRRDLLSCFGYGPGTHIRFLYRRRWIAESILTNPPSKGTQCVIVFCEQPPTQNCALPPEIRPTHADPEFTFYALMLARWVGIEWKRFISRFGEDDFLPVEFVLERPVMLAPSDLEGAIDVWREVIVADPRDHPRPLGAADAARSKFVFERNSMPAEYPTNTTEDLAWLTLAQALSKTRSLGNCSFYRVKSITKVRGHVQLGKPIVPRTEGGIRVYRLRSDRTYRFDLQMLSTPGRVSVDRLLTPKVALPALRFSQPFIASRGRTNQFHLLLYCPRTYAQQSDVVVFDAAASTPEQASAAGGAAANVESGTAPEGNSSQSTAREQAENAPRIEIPIIIGPPAWWELAGAILLLAVGLALVTPTKELLDSPDFAAFTWLKAHAEPVLAVARVAGAILAAIGLYLGFRVTPSSRL
ncbi:MAG: hypothetical protein JO036_05395 [Candidatus Eremiobacteraeota bacterium]|nr:hypothetical protein [Candidatus Eremiobacteraeota bacterium]